MYRDESEESLLDCYLICTACTVWVSFLKSQLVREAFLLIGLMLLGSFVSILVTAGLLSLVTIGLLSLAFISMSVVCIVFSTFGISVECLYETVDGYLGVVIVWLSRTSVCKACKYLSALFLCTWPYL